MKRKKIRLRQIIVTALAAMVLFSGVLTVFAGTGIVYDRRQIVLEGGSSTWSFVVDDGRGKMNGACMNPKNLIIPEGGNSAEFIHLSGDSRLAKLAYIGSSEFKTDVQQYAVGRAAAYIAGHIGYNNYRYQSLVNSLIARSSSVVVPTGFEAFIVKPNNGGQSILAWRDEGKIRIKKEVKSNKHLVSECKENYSLAGAVYGVYKSKSHASTDTNRVLTLITDVAGNTSEYSIVPGTYYVREIKSPPGFDIDIKTHEVVVKPKATGIAISKDAPLLDPLGIKIIKKADSNSHSSLSLEGAEYTVKYYKEFLDLTSVKNAKPYKTWVFKTDSNGEIRLWDDWKVGGDELFKDEDGVPVGLFGTYTFEESKAPDGFVKTEGIISLQQVKPEELRDNPDNTILKDVIDIEKSKTISIVLSKVDEETGENIPQGFGSLEGAEYDLFYFDDELNDFVKVKKLITDKYGYAKYENGRPGKYRLIETKASAGYNIDPKFHEIEAKASDENQVNVEYVVKSQEKPIKVEIEKTTINHIGKKIHLDGAKLQLMDNKKNVIETFTSNNSSHMIKGLMPGKYFLREIETPKGYFSLKDEIAFEVKAMSTIQKIEVFNEPKPEIKSFATSKPNGGKSLYGTKDAKIYDKVEYKKLVPGKTYTVKGVLIDKESKTPIKNNGKPITSEITFVAKSTNGSLTVDFSLDASNLISKEIVVFEEIYSEDVLVAAHTDINDMDQTVEVVNPPIIPNTGDSSKVTMYICMMTVAMMGLLFNYKKIDE